MWYLGLENTFIAVPYEEDIPGTYSTPANQRTDINTLPDPKMQTTPKDIGTLLEMIYQCAAGGGARGDVSGPLAQGREGHKESALAALGETRSALHLLADLLD